MRMFSSIGVALVAAISIGTIQSALAASAIQKECSGKYQAAKSAGTLNGMSYKQYYSQCSAAAKAEPAPAPSAAAAAAPTAPAAGAPPETKAELKAEKKVEKEKEKAEKKEEKAEKKEEKEKEKAAKKGEPAPTPASTAPAAPAPAAPAPTTTAARPAPSAPVANGNATFPTAVSAEFSKEKAGTARMHTCLAQYKANKDSNGNGGLKWIEKGGGYYSECNKRLKG